MLQDIVTSTETEPSWDASDIAAAALQTARSAEDIERAYNACKFLGVRSVERVTTYTGVEEAQVDTIDVDLLYQFRKSGDVRKKVIIRAGRGPAFASD